jgi:hypothetical protein
MSDMGSRIEAADDRGNMLEERNSAEKCLAICNRSYAQVNQMKVNIYKDNSAKKYAHQVIVSTKGYPILAHKVNADEWATQWYGQMSDATLQQLSKDRAIVLPRHPGLNTSPAAPTEGTIILEDLLEPTPVPR